MLYHVFSDNRVLTDVRREILALVHEDGVVGKLEAGYSCLYRNSTFCT
jgi:hypothetical protein